MHKYLNTDYVHKLTGNVNVHSLNVHSHCIDWKNTFLFIAKNILFLVCAAAHLQ